MDLSIFEEIFMFPCLQAEKGCLGSVDELKLIEKNDPFFRPPLSESVHSTQHLRRPLPKYMLTDTSLFLDGILFFRREPVENR